MHYSPTPAIMNTPTLNAPEIPVIRSLRRLLCDGPTILLKNAEEFSDRVDELKGYAWRLSSKEMNFLEQVLRLRQELALDVPFFEVVEGDERRYQRAINGHRQEMWRARETIGTYESTLAASLAEDEFVSKRINAAECDLINLMQKKECLQAEIQGDGPQL
ncbi:hypothetical protein A2U01_0023555 [Trifolium medium]|uniref:Uncharacterized protein n=1 Tax=Trifolium medium TaxID=97028 RepID=A0A392NSW9_9FABA|nr:hypothetical protein [Trifolium medium]